MDAANLGRNIASAQGTNASIASQLGAGAVGSANSALGAAASGQGILNSGYAGAQAGLAGAANTYSQIASNQIKAGQTSDGLWGGLGGAAGSIGAAAITKWSDRTMKEDIREASTKSALKAVRDTPVAFWRYKNDSKGADGGQKHLGPMAQDLQKNAGDEVAPGGKQIDLISANGLVMGAVQELAERVDSIATKVGAGKSRAASKKGKGSNQFIAALA